MGCIFKGSGVVSVMSSYVHFICIYVNGAFNSVNCTIIRNDNYFSWCQRFSQVGLHCVVVVNRQKM